MSEISTSPELSFPTSTRKKLATTTTISLNLYYETDPDNAGSVKT
jgi:hypothetical protein